MYSLNTIVILFMCFICLSVVDESNPETIPGYSEGIFDRFLRNYLDVLSTAFTGKELKRYCSIMHKELYKMEFTYTKRLAKHFRRLSKMHRDNVVDELTQYRRDFDEKLPRQQEFFIAINGAFTLQHNLQFDDYVHALLEFGRGHLLFITIQENTRKILNMILNCIDKMGERERRDLEKIMKKAVKEYNLSH